MNNIEELIKLIKKNTGALDVDFYEMNTITGMRLVYFIILFKDLTVYKSKAFFIPSCNCETNEIEYYNEIFEFIAEEIYYFNDDIKRKYHELDDFINSKEVFGLLAKHIIKSFITTDKNDIDRLEYFKYLMNKKGVEKDTKDLIKEELNKK